MEKQAGLKRLTYAPKVNAWVRTDAGIIDISDFIVRGTVSRVVNEVSTAQLEIRNPKKKFTKPGNPTFMPMDGITIFLSRFDAHPVQVFTGYLDSTPLLQLYPGICTLRASCTLKRLLHTYWDPGLLFSMQWLARHGWVADPNTGTATKTPGSGQAGSTGSLESNPFETLADANGVLTDSGFGELLLGAVTEIGHWDPKSVYIEAIPPSMVTVATNYIKRVTENSGPFGTDPEKLIKQFIHRMIGPYVGGGSTPSNSDSGTPSSGTANIDNAPQALLNFPRKEVYTQSELVQLYTAAEFPDPHYAAATSWCESSGNTKADSNCSTHGACVPTPVITAKDGRTVFPCCHGLWQLFLGNSPVDNGVFSATTEGLANAEDPIISTYYVSEYIKRTGDFSPWDCVSLGFIG